MSTAASTARPELVEAVHVALSGVDDPELPGIGIVELGMVEEVRVAPDGVVSVALVPTFSGCPALAAIRHDVIGAVSAVPGVSSVAAEFVDAPVWSVDRVSASARHRLASAFGIAVAPSDGTPPACTRCGAPTQGVSTFGPTRCRSVSRCTGCGEVVEVMRS